MRISLSSSCISNCDLRRSLISLEIFAEDCSSSFASCCCSSVCLRAASLSTSIRFSLSILRSLLTRISCSLRRSAKSVSFTEWEAAPFIPAVPAGSSPLPSLGAAAAFLIGIRCCRARCISACIATICSARDPFRFIPALSILVHCLLLSCASSVFCKRAISSLYLCSRRMYDSCLLCRSLSNSRIRRSHVSVWDSRWQIWAVNCSLRFSVIRDGCGESLPNLPDLRMAFPQPVTGGDAGAVAAPLVPSPEPATLEEAPVRYLEKPGVPLPRRVWVDPEPVLGAAQALTPAS
mmetsp:Transcript_32307/g.91603  ORF Transcript_32307/g.91603 Transcript_32307/m.91603 type:complete len:292 (+) Transcript_32307:249-1124(+)